MRVLGIIPAREGSKRVPHKNFRPFAGTTLTDLAIRQGLEATRLTDLFVSSDSEEVLVIVEKYENVILLPHPAEISGDDAPAIEYVRHALAELEPKLGLSFDVVVGCP